MMDAPSSQQPKIRVSVIALGNIHRDHSMQVMLLTQMKYLVRQGFKIFYCNEQEEDQTLKVKVSRDSECAKNNERYLAIPSIAKIKHPPDKDHAKPYFNLIDIPTVQKALLELKPTASQGETNYAAELITRFQMFIHQIPINHFLVAHQIPLQGLELPLRERSKLLMDYSHRAIPDTEETRIQRMVINFFEKVLPRVQQNTLIISTGGILHSRRLAANILAEHQKHSNSTFEIRATALNCVSNYGMDNWKPMCDLIQEMEKKDSETIQEQYKTLPLHTAVLKEINNGEDFESEEFCKAFQEASQFVKPPKFYFIPTITPEKRLLLDELKQGNIIERGNDVCVLLRSGDLTAERRKVLGIDRRLIKLGVQKEKQLEELKTRKTTITLEETCYPHKYLVTFPPSELPFMEDVIHGKEKGKPQNVLGKQGNSK